MLLLFLKKLLLITGWKCGPPWRNYYYYYYSFPTSPNPSPLSQRSFFFAFFSYVRNVELTTTNGVQESTTGGALDWHIQSTLSSETLPRVCLYSTYYIQAIRTDAFEINSYGILSLSYPIFGRPKNEVARYPIRRSCLLGKHACVLCVWRAKALVFTCRPSPVTLKWEVKYMIWSSLRKPQCLSW